MRFRMKPIVLVVAASAVVCGAAALPAQAGTPVASTQAVSSPKNSTVKATAMPKGESWAFIGSRVDIQNETGEPIAFKYDSDGSGQGRDMYFINEDGTPVTPYSSRKVDPGYVAPFWVDTSSLVDDGDSLASLDGNAEADLYPIGVWSGTRYQPIRIRANQEDDYSSFRYDISADYVQGDRHSAARSNSPQTEHGLYPYVGKISGGLSITDQPVALSALPAAK